MVVSPKKILWPTDFSQLSMHGGRYAHGFRDVFGAELHVIHVVPPPLNPDVSVMIPAELPSNVGEKEVLRAARAGIDELIEKEFGKDPKIIRDVFYGNPWHTICDYAARNAIDLIVLGTHGRTGIARVLIGSTAERIVQHAPCPVLTVKADEKEFLIE